MNHRLADLCSALFSDVSMVFLCIGGLFFEFD